MRKFVAFLFVVILTSMANAKTTGRGGLYFGTKTLDSADWDPLDQQSAWGLQLDVKNDAWPVWATFGFVDSRDEQTLVTSTLPFATTEIEGKTREYLLGVKKDFLPLKSVRLSVAGGPAFLRASLDRAVAPYDGDSDSALGFWVGGDALVYIGFIVVGVSYQYSKGDVDLLGRSVNAGGKNLAFALGFGW